MLRVLVVAEKSTSDAMVASELKSNSQSDGVTPVLFRAKDLVAVNVSAELGHGAQPH